MRDYIELNYIQDAASKSRNFFTLTLKHSRYAKSDWCFIPISRLMAAKMVEYFQKHTYARSYTTNVFLEYNYTQFHSVQNCPAEVTVYKVPFMGIDAYTFVIKSIECENLQSFDVTFTIDCEYTDNRRCINDLKKFAYESYVMREAKLKSYEVDEDSFLAFYNEK